MESEQYILKWMIECLFRIQKPTKDLDSRFGGISILSFLHTSVRGEIIKVIQTLNESFENISSIYSLSRSRMHGKSQNTTGKCKYLYNKKLPVKVY